MAKPSSVVVWASDANVSVGPEAGQPTKVDPASAAAQGAIAGRAAPARWYNFLFNHFSQWAAYLNALHTEVEFLNKDYDWTGEHSFGGDVEVNAPANFTVAPTFPAGFTAAGFVANPGSIGLAGGTNEVLYTDGAGVAALRPRTVFLPLAVGQISANVTGNVSAFFTNNTGFWEFRETAQVTFPLSLLVLPRGSVIDEIKIGVTNSSGGTINMSCNIYGKAPNVAVPSLPFAAGFGGPGGVGPDFDLPASTDHVFTMVPTPGPITIDNSVSEYHIVVDGQDGGRIQWVQVTYLDPGPRNG